MKMIAHKNTTVVNKKFVAIGFLLWLVSAVAYVLHTVPFYSEEERQRIRAVGVAVEKYEAILDTEWMDENCSLEHCPNSSKSLPGMPPDRAPFTTHERTNMERHGPYAHLQPVTTMNIFRVTARDDGTVEVLTQTTVTKCYSPADADPYGSALNFYAITLAPSTIRGEYVVVDDVYYDVLKHPLPADARPVYVGGPKNPPPCA
jgi:hypothetical protein